MKKWRGSYTLEAIVWMWLLLSTITVAISTGVKLWEETVALITELEEKEELDVVEIMYRVELMEELVSQWVD